MSKREAQSEKVNSKPVAYADNNKADHLGGNWFSPVEESVRMDITDEE